jgi:carbamoyltransferase
MPFAPMIMGEHFEKVFPLSKSKYAAQFMTLTYQTHDSWIYKIPAVIQKSDKTARPQVVEKASLPMVWELMNSYYELSGIPLLLNTSFNAHDEPIIENPNHAFVHLENKVIDKLVIGNYVYENK